MDDRDKKLLGILKIGHDTSMRGAGISLREAQARYDYKGLRPSFGPRDLLPLVLAHEEIIEEWIAYSEDKRTSAGWYLERNGRIGRIDVPHTPLQFASLAEAVANYVVHELDSWAAVGDAD